MMSPDTGVVPEYIPHHLRGKVNTSRNEPDGMVSFMDTDAASGLSPEYSRVTLNRDRYDKTFDPQTRRLKFPDALREQYAPLEQENADPLNTVIGQKLRQAFDYATSTRGRAIGTAGGLSALAGGMGGFLLNRFREKSPWSGALWGSLLAGGLGSLATAIMQRQWQKREQAMNVAQAAFDKSASTAGLVRVLENDPTLTSQARAQILMSLSRAPEQTQADVGRLLRTTAGVGAGMLIMRFLRAKGLLPILTGGILGGIIGHNY